MGSSVRVNRKTFRIILLALMLISAAFAAWSWMRPYEWSPDPKAQVRIVGCFVDRDHSNYWVNLEIKVPSGAEYDLEKQVSLVNSAGDRIEPADTTLEGDNAQAIRQIWLKFWLDKEQLKGPLDLEINEGRLKVRSGSGLPKLRSDGNRYFVTHAW